MLTSYDRDARLCPYCGGSNVADNGSSSTMLGYSAGELDPNHHSTALTCRTCSRRFFIEWVPRQGGFAVVADDRHVLFGTPPHCCRYRYSVDCACGGRVQHNSVTAGRRLSSTEMRWVCGSCGDESPDERYLPVVVDVP